MLSSCRRFAASVLVPSFKSLRVGRLSVKSHHDRLKHDFSNRLFESGQLRHCSLSRSSSDASTRLDGARTKLVETGTHQGECPKDDGASGPEQEKPKERLQIWPTSAERSFREWLLALTLPLSTTFARFNMVLLNAVFPDAFDYNEFRVGATQAFEFVHDALCAKAHDQLHDLFSQELFSKIAQHERCNVGRVGSFRHELQEVQFVGLLQAWVEPLPSGDCLLLVKAGFYAKEDAIDDRQIEPGVELSEIVRYRQERLHLWTFEQHLVDGTENYGDWSIVDMDKLVWPPDHLPSGQKSA